MSRIKPHKKDKETKISLREMQQNTEELNKSVNDPVYFYNTYVRKEGQKILTKEEYTKEVKKWKIATGKPFLYTFEMGIKEEQQGEPTAISNITKSKLENNAE